MCCGLHEIRSAIDSNRKGEKSSCAAYRGQPKLRPGLTYGTISSFKPLRNKIGILVILGRVFSLVQF